MLAILLFAQFLLFACPSTCAVSVDIRQAQIKKIQLGVKAFDGYRGVEVADVIKNDLTRSGMFDIFNIVRDSSAQQADSVLTGTVSEENGHVVLRFKIWDVHQKMFVVDREVKILEDHWRRSCHIASDTIYQYMTGHPAYNDAKLLFVSKSDRYERLASVHPDGSDLVYISGPSQKSLFSKPVMSPDNTHVLYVSYKDNSPNVHLLDLRTGQSEILLPGCFSMSPSFSADGKEALISVADEKSNTTSIHSVQIAKTGGARSSNKLTKRNGVVDLSPSSGPDSRYVTFSSNRSGGYQVHILDRQNDSVKQITHGPGQCYSPRWSPLGNLIAFIRVYKNEFSLCIVRPDGTGFDVIERAHFVDNPYWAPNGSSIVFMKRDSGVSKLYVTDINSRHSYNVEMREQGIDPSWSDVLHSS